MGEMKVKPQRKNEIIIGVLFLLATASYMLGSGLVENALKITDFNLINAEQNKNRYLIGINNFRCSRWYCCPYLPDSKKI